MKQLTTKEAWKLLELTGFYTIIIFLFGALTNSGFVLFIGTLIFIAASIIQLYIQRQKYQVKEVK